jgi:hypothetical protein
MLVVRVGAGSERLKSMHFVLLAFKSSWRPRKECCMALKLVWRLVKCPKKGQMYTEWSRLCRGGSGNHRSKRNIVDIYREKSRPEN